MIPGGTLYGNPELGAGEVATIEDVTLTTEQAGADIGYGQGVQIKDGLLVPATSGNIYAKPQGLLCRVQKIGHNVWLKQN